MTAPERPGAGAREARILVVDDSTFVRKALRRVFEARPGLAVAGEAGDGLEAVRMCAALTPDIVTLDIQMPGMDGLSALREIKRRWPSLPVLVLASAASNGPETALEALELGAFDFVDKGRFRSMDFQIMGDEVVRKVRVGLSGTPAAPLPAAPPAPRRESPRRSVRTSPLRRDAEAICIGASTGGPAALQVILERLPAGFPFPIAIVQHMPMGFTAAFAERLNQSSRLEVREARGGEAFRPGWAFLAPAGQHLVFGRGAAGGAELSLSAEPSGGAHVPSVDVLLSSAAGAFGSRAIGVVLTGMGSDGREGARELAARGGTLVAESESSCAVYGMPRAIVEAGLASAVWDLEEIATELCRLAGEPSAEEGVDR